MSSRPFRKEFTKSRLFFVNNDFNNQPTIRQIKWSLSENIKLIPTNPKYKTETIEKDTSEFLVNVIGKVIININKILS